MRFADLWRWDGKVSRGKYAAVGLIGVAIKHNLDRLIAGRFLGYERSFFNYWAPLGKAARLDRLSGTEARFLATILLFSIPFLWVGVAMTVRRLGGVGGREGVGGVVFFSVVQRRVFFVLSCVAAPPRP